jgi:hypothetical protein
MPHSKVSRMSYSNLARRFSLMMRVGASSTLGAGLAAGLLGAVSKVRFFFDTVDKFLRELGLGLIIAANGLAVLW